MACMKPVQFIHSLNRRFVLRAILATLLSAVIYMSPVTAQERNPVPPAPPLPQDAPPRPKADFSTVLRGGKLFRKNCATCHGPLGQGRPGWYKPDRNGKYPPPPLNGTGHTWHHSAKILKEIIKNGTGKLGGNMPAWKDKLSDQEIDSILEWIKAQWPDNVYAAWRERDLQDQ